jgi:biofilm PGA synthesis N-glycosyltransferase PgaC
VPGNLTSLRWWFGFKPKAALGPPVNLPLTVLIAAYNEEDFLGETIEAILVQTWKPSKIVVVDDCSTDRTGDVARRFGNNLYGIPIEVVRTPENKGSKASAQNYALKHASLIQTPLVASVDADTILAVNGIEEMLCCLNDPAVGVVCSAVLPKTVENRWQRGRLCVYLYMLPVIKRVQNHYRKIVVVSGCFAIFRIECLRELGFFDERTPTEDMDFTFALQGSRWSAACSQEAMCYPVEPHNFTEYRKQGRRWQSGLPRCIMVRNWRWFWDRKLFSLWVGFYFATSFLGPILTLVSAVLWTFFWENALTGILTMIITQMFLVWLPILIQAKRKERFWIALRSIPDFILVQYVDMGIFMYVIYQEVRGNKVVKFEKGHGASVATPSTRS